MSETASSDGAPVPPPLPILKQPSFKQEISALPPYPNKESFQDEVSRLFSLYWLNGNSSRMQGTSLCNEVKSILQDGPMCGLVALSMASQQISKGVLSVEHLLAKAQESKFSKQGEIFSIESMEKLARTCLVAEARVLHDLKSNVLTIVKHLQCGWPVLVPYDADGNHEPALKNGHKAHWAILIGYCLLTANSDGKCALEHLKPGTPLPLDVEARLKSNNFEKLVVYAKQGKSNYIKSWDFEMLCQSNSNLLEVSPKLGTNDYVMPADRSLKTSLCDQFLMIKPFN